MTASAATVGSPEIQRFLDTFARLENEGRLSRLGLRKEALSRLEAVGFPGPRHEDWKFTSLAPLLQVPFQPAEFRAHLLEPEPLLKALGTQASVLTEHPSMHAPARLVFVNGFFAPALSVLPEEITASLRNEKDVDTQEHIGQYADFENNALTALNTALYESGIYLELRPNQVIQEPVHLLFLTVPEKPHLAFPRFLIVMGAHSQLTVVESHLGFVGSKAHTGSEVPEVPKVSEVPTWNCGVGEIVVAEGAHLEHYKIQEENLSTFHYSNLQVVIGRHGRFTSQYIGLGGSWVRNEVRVRFEAVGGEATVNGLYLAEGVQHMDNHTVIDHAHPHCASHELYKGILADKARGVFNGKIFVHPQAQKTDAKQTNQTLLLSDDATINTKPQLEIFADDVKCTHGATVGQLPMEQIFYLRSRGIGIEQARALLTFAFANDIIARIRVDGIRRRLEERFLTAQRLPHMDLIDLGDFGDT